MIEKQMANAAIFADRLPTDEAMLAVIVVPIFSPRNIAAATSNGIQPSVTII